VELHRHARALGPRRQVEGALGKVAARATTLAELMRGPYRHVLGA